MSLANSAIKGPKRLVEAVDSARSRVKFAMIYGAVLATLALTAAWIDGASKREIAILCAVFAVLLIADHVVFVFFDDLKAILSGLYEDQRELLLKTANELKEEAKAGTNELSEELGELQSELRRNA